MNRRALHFLRFVPSLFVLMALGACVTTVTDTRTGMIKDDFEAGIDRPPTARTLYALANLLVSQGRVQDGAVTYQRVNAEYPEFMPAYSALAEIYTQAGQYEAAQAVLAAGLKVSPSDPVLLNNSGFISLLQQNNSSALESFTHALQVVPYHPRYKSNRALALLLLGREDEALALYEQVLSPEDARHNIEVIKRRHPSLDAVTIIGEEPERVVETADEPDVEIEVAQASESEAILDLAPKSEPEPEVKVSESPRHEELENETPEAQVTEVSENALAVADPEPQIEEAAPEEVSVVAEVEKVDVLPPAAEHEAQDEAPIEETEPTEPTGEVAETPLAEVVEIASPSEVSAPDAPEPVEVAPEDSVKVAGLDDDAMVVPNLAPLRFNETSGEAPEPAVSQSAEAEIVDVEAGEEGFEETGANDSSERSAGVTVLSDDDFAVVVAQSPRAEIETESEASVDFEEALVLAAMERADELDVSEAPPARQEGADAEAVSIDETDDIWASIPTADDSAESEMIPAEARPVEVEVVEALPMEPRPVSELVLLLAGAMVESAPVEIDDEFVPSEADEFLMDFEGAGDWGAAPTAVEGIAMEPFTDAVEAPVVEEDAAAEPETREESAEEIAAVFEPLVLSDIDFSSGAGERVAIESPNEKPLVADPLDSEDEETLSAEDVLRAFVPDESLPNDEIARPSESVDGSRPTPESVLPAIDISASEPDSAPDTDTEPDLFFETLSSFNASEDASEPTAEEHGEVGAESGEAVGEVGAEVDAEAGDKSSDTDATFEELRSVIQTGAVGPELDEALRVLTRDYADHADISDVCGGVTYSNSPEVEKFLRAVIENNTDAEALGQARMSLGIHLKQLTYLLGRLRFANDALVARIERDHGAEFVRAIRDRDPDALQVESEALIEQAREDLRSAAP